MARQSSGKKLQKYNVYLEQSSYNKISLLALYLANKGHKSKFNRPVSISSLLNEALNAYLDMNKDTVEHIYNMIESEIPFPQIFSGEL